MDAFQGREKDFIIMSAVRSNEHQGIGFLNDSRRLNVALTRAKYGIIIIGNPKVLSKQPLWYHLLTFYKEHRVMVEGALANLKECQIQLNRPRKMLNHFVPGNNYLRSVQNQQLNENLNIVDTFNNLNLNNNMTSLSSNLSTLGLPNHHFSTQFRSHDPLGYISAERVNNTGFGNLPVPIGMFINMGTTPIAAQQRYLSNPASIGAGPVANQRKPTGKPTSRNQQNRGQMRSQMNSNLNSQFSSNGGSQLSQGLLTQGQNLSFPPLSGMSQQPLSQPVMSEMSQSVMMSQSQDFSQVPVCHSSYNSFN